jgi:hypothetical protein
VLVFTPVGAYIGFLSTHAAAPRRHRGRGTAVAIDPGAD